MGFSLNLSEMLDSWSKKKEEAHPTACSCSLSLSLTWDKPRTSFLDGQKNCTTSWASSAQRLMVAAVFRLQLKEQRSPSTEMLRPYWSIHRSQSEMFPASKSSSFPELSAGAVCTPRSLAQFEESRMISPSGNPTCKQSTADASERSKTVNSIWWYLGEYDAYGMHSLKWQMA